MGARLSNAKKKAKRRSHRTFRVKHEAEKAGLSLNGLRAKKIAHGLSLKSAERRPANDR